MPVFNAEFNINEYLFFKLIFIEPYNITSWKFSSENITLQIKFFIIQVVVKETVLKLTLESVIGIYLPALFTFTLFCLYLSCTDI